MQGTEGMSDNMLIEHKTADSVIERNMIVNGVAVHIKSIFSGKIPLEKALGNIAVRKLANQNN